MPQGALKSKATKPKSKVLHSTKQKQKSAPHKIIKPKDYKKAQAREMTRKGAAGLTSNLERMLAERAGHTEMVKGEKSRKAGLGNAGKGNGGMGAAKKVQGKK